MTRRRKLFLGALLIVAVAVIPPSAIFFSYPLDAPSLSIVTPWTAGEMLSYCGAIGAAVIAIFGVYWSIRDGSRSRERQQRDEVAPFFSAVFLMQENKRDAFSEMFRATRRRCSNRDEAEGAFEGLDNHGAEVQVGKGFAGCDGAERMEGNLECISGSTEYRETDSRKVYVILGDTISYAKELSEEQLRYVRSSSLNERMASGVTAIVPNRVIYRPINLMNAGKGAAISVRVGVNPKDSDWSGVKYWTLMPEEHFYLGIYVDTEKKAAYGEYELRLVYFDCLGCQYMQRFELNVVREDNGSVPAVQMGLYGPRELLSDRERERYLKNLKECL